MTIDEIKSVSIRQWLSANNYGDGYRKGRRLFYLSPFRNERNPSFCVNTEANLWYDYGIGEGGNLINLVQKIHPEWDNHQVLSYLESQIQHHRLQYSVDYEGQRRQEEEKQQWIQEQQEDRERNTIVTHTTMLVHPFLRSYILERRIDFEVARKYCQEVHYTYNNKEYYAIGFENIDGGMEVRNKYSKRCIGKKSISVILPYGQKQDHCCIFEGFFDMLTYMTMQRWMRMDITIPDTCDYLVLNSTACLKQLLPHLANYRSIHCYLDNDEAGKAATQTILSAYPGIAIDESDRYKGYNDLNDLLCGKPSVEESEHS